MEYKCESCDKVYKSRKAMVLHVKEKHGDIVFECDICQRSFKSKRARDNHVKTSHGEKQYKCSRCDKKFGRKHVLNRHEKTHTKQSSFACAVCNEVFSTTTDLRTHHTQNHLAIAQEPAAKKQKTSDEPRQKKSKPKSNINSIDPPLFDATIVEGREMRKVYRDNWDKIRTVYKTGRPIEDTYNFRLQRGHVNSEVRDLVSEVFEKQKSAFKISLSLGCILVHTVTGELRYFYSCRNNHCVLKSPKLIINQQDLNTYLEALHDLDLHEMAKQRRPNSNWVLDHITTVSYTHLTLPTKA